MELAPDKAQYRYWLAQGYIATGRYDDAIKSLTLLRDTRPEDASISLEAVDREIRRAAYARNSGQ